MKKIADIVAAPATYLLGLTFLFSALMKAIDPAGTAIKIGEYLSSFALGSFVGASTLLSFLLFSLEFTLGTLAVSGCYRRRTPLLMVIVMAFMTLLTAYLALFNPVKDCGCFGDAFHLTNWETFGKNIILTACALIFFLRPPSVPALFSPGYQPLATVVTIAAIAAFGLLNLRHLPIKDFRPFRVNANLESLVTVPDGAAVDEYEFRFLYKKGNRQQSFSMDSLPDSTWIFVDRTEKLVREGYRPPVSDFHIFSYAGEELTDSILHLVRYGSENNGKGVFFLLSPDWKTADRNNIDRIGDLYDRAKAEGIGFVGLSGSTHREAEEWRNRTGADYPLLLLDAGTVKTMIRANPGLMYLRASEIAGKWASADFPDGDEVQTFLDEIDRTKFVHPSMQLTLAPLYAWGLMIIFAGSLRLGRGIRIFRAKRRE